MAHQQMDCDGQRQELQRRRGGVQFDLATYQKQRAGGFYGIERTISNAAATVGASDQTANEDKMTGQPKMENGDW